MSVEYFRTLKSPYFGAVSLFKYLALEDPIPRTFVVESSPADTGDTASSFDADLPEGVREGSKQSFFNLATDRPPPPPRLRFHPRSFHRAILPQKAIIVSLSTRMKYTDIKSRLRGIQSIIENTRNSQKTRGTYLEEMGPLLQNNSTLGDEVEKRAKYYQALSVDPAYKKLIDSIHASLKVLAKALGSHAKTFWTADKRAGTDGRIPYTFGEFLADLDDWKRWFVLGENSYVDHPLGEDSIRCPWRHVLAQYEDCIERLNEIREEMPDDKLESAIDQYATNVASLHQLLSGAWEGERHIKFFEQFRDDLDLIKDESNPIPSRMRTSAIVVITDLLESIQEKERNSFPLKYHDGTFEYNNRKHSPKSKADYLLLCDSFYPFCPKSGRLGWKAVAEKIRAERPNRPTPTKEEMRLMVRSLNRWAQKDRLHESDILTLEKGDIVRLL